MHPYLLGLLSLGVLPYLALASEARFENLAWAARSLHLCLLFRLPFHLFLFRHPCSTPSDLLSHH